MSQGTWTGALYQPKGVGWEGRWVGSSRGRGHMYTYVWFMLMFDRKQQNYVKQLSFNLKINKLLKDYFQNLGDFHQAVASNVPGATVALFLSLHSLDSSGPYYRETKPAAPKLQQNLWAGRALKSSLGSKSPAEGGGGVPTSSLHSQGHPNCRWLHPPHSSLAEIGMCPGDKG